jgi:pectate lyase
MDRLLRFSTAALVCFLWIACSSDDDEPSSNGASENGVAPSLPVSPGASSSGGGAAPGSTVAAGDAGGDGAAAQPAVVEDCNAYPFKAQTLLAERVGFGRNVTGGDPTKIYRVTTLAGSGPGSLRVALESADPWWIVFDVNGKITHPTRVAVKSNKTIDGRGRDIDIEGLLQMTDVSNIIISDVKVENSLEGHCTQNGDVVNTSSKVVNPKGTYTMHDVWIHHVEAFNGGDGLIDLRAGTDYTVSWTHFHTHKKGLLWHNEVDMMRVTAHHNFFDRISLRGPQFIAGQIHFFNNYQYHWYEYGAGGLGGAQFHSQANVYEARPGTICTPLSGSCADPNPCGDTDYQISKEALVSEWSAGNGIGYTKSVGDLALNGAVLSVNDPTKVFDPSAVYGYTAEPATAALATKIKADAGPRAGYCKKN